MTPSDLTARLKAEFSAAETRITQFQQQAEHSYEEMQVRYEKFQQIRAQVGEVARPKIESLLEMFPKVETKLIPHRQGREVIVSFEKTPDCLAHVQLKLAATCDEDVRNVIASYDLEILPIFLKFDSHHELSQPIETCSVDKIASWIDDRLVEFVRTYLSLQFVDQYQRDNMVTDPIALQRFPKNFAKGTADYHGNTYYFLSQQTLEEFQKDPASHLLGAKQA